MMTLKLWAMVIDFNFETGNKNGNIYDSVLSIPWTFTWNTEHIPLVQWSCLLMFPSDLLFISCLIHSNFCILIWHEKTFSMSYILMKIWNTLWYYIPQPNWLFLVPHRGQILYYQIWYGHIPAFKIVYLSL